MPHKFMSLMENPELYPQGWRSRKFFGSRKGKDKNKKQCLGMDVVDQIMREVENEDKQDSVPQSGAQGHEEQTELPTGGTSNTM